MRLLRFGILGREKAGVLLNGKRRDLSAYFPDWNSTFFVESGIEKLSAILEADEEHRFPAVSESARWGSPVARPGKIVCVGLNFSDHAKEAGMPVPTEAVLFLKATNTVVGPFDDIFIPRNSTKTDWEVEQGKELRHLQPAWAVADNLRRIARCLKVANDAQREWPVDAKWQYGNHDLSARTACALHFAIHDAGAGDLVSTGTPPGVGLGMTPPRSLKHGDFVELEIQHLGKQRQNCRQV